MKTTNETESNFIGVSFTQNTFEKIANSGEFEENISDYEKDFIKNNLPDNLDNNEKAIFKNKNYIIAIFYSKTLITKTELEDYYKNKLKNKDCECSTLKNMVNLQQKED